MSSTVSRIFVYSVGDVLLLVSCNLSRIIGGTDMIEESPDMIDNCPSRRSCIIGMPDCSWLKGRWVLVQARIRAGIDANLEADSRDPDLYSFRGLNKSTLESEIPRSRLMWEC